MKDIILKIKNWGCDVQGALDRFMGDEQLYIECLYELGRDTSIEQLQQAIEQRDIKTAFYHAHTIKGVCANMGITPVFEAVVPVVDKLRAGNSDGIEQDFEHFIKQYNMYKSLL